MPKADCSIITETPGIDASHEQWSMLYTRYYIAAERADGKDVLEVACGAGIGLSYIAKHAKSVVAGDIDEANLQIATTNHADNAKVRVQYLDAHDLTFPDNSFDLVLLYETIYYLDDPSRFVTEAKRVLRPGGTLIVVSVNCNWSGFNPSPFSARYLTAPDLFSLISTAGFSVELFGAFPDVIEGTKQRVVSLVRQVAVKLHLIPKSMKGKELLKRLFMGKLKPLPDKLKEGAAPVEPLSAISSGDPRPEYKAIYAFA